MRSDANGRIPIRSILPDGAGTFQMPFLGRDFSDAVQYRIQVEGNPDR